MKKSTIYSTTLVLGLAVSWGCDGTMALKAGTDAVSPDDQRGDDPSEELLPDDEGVDVEVSADAAPPAVHGVRRLTSFEYDNALSDLLGDDARPASALAEPTETTFGNAAGLQAPSGLLIESAEVLALQAAETALGDEARRDRVVGCEPAAPDDVDCLREFAERFGRLALRRPLTEAEVDDLAQFSEYGGETGDFYFAAKMVVRTLLQHAEFLYRVETGQPVSGAPDLYVLNDYEMASRMAFLLWGSIPDEELLDAAEAGELSTAEGRRAQAERMVWGSERDRNKTIRRVQHFHALWLGYEHVQLPDVLGFLGRAETDGVIRTLLFDRQRPWRELFTHDATLVDEDLAAHYGYDYPEGESGFTWFDYPDDSGRAGLLSHATVLNAGTKLGHTSPTMRGLFVLRRMMCGNVAPVPPDINPDEVPLGLCEAGACISPSAVVGRACETNDDCPVELACISEHSKHYLETATCAGCHSQMDPIGLGLENFDAFGRYRDFESEKPNLPEGETQPDCPIDGTGELPGRETVEFFGPKELGEGLLESGGLEPCMSRHFYQFAYGLEHLPYASDPGAQRFFNLYEQHDGNFVETLIAFVAHDDFAFRRSAENR